MSNIIDVKSTNTINLSYLALALYISAFITPFIISDFNGLPFGEKITFIATITSFTALFFIAMRFDKRIIKSISYLAIKITGKNIRVLSRFMGIINNKLFDRSIDTDLKSSLTNKNLKLAGALNSPFVKSDYGRILLNLIMALASFFVILNLLHFQDTFIQSETKFWIAIFLTGLIILFLFNAFSLNYYSIPVFTYIALYHYFTRRPETQDDLKSHIANLRTNLTLNDWDGAKVLILQLDDKAGSEFLKGFRDQNRNGELPEMFDKIKNFANTESLKLGEGTTFVKTDKLDEYNRALLGKGFFGLDKHGFEYHNLLHTLIELGETFNSTIITMQQEIKHNLGFAETDPLTNDNHQAIGNEIKTLIENNEERFLSVQKNFLCTMKKFYEIPNHLKPEEKAILDPIFTLEFECWKK